MHRDGGVQAAIPHLPRIRMNAPGEASAKTGFVELERTTTSSRSSAARSRGQNPAPKWRGRSPVNRAMDGEPPSDLPPDGAGALTSRREGAGRFEIPLRPANRPS